MSLSILHTADWHIGCLRNKIPEYLDNQRKGLFELVEYAIQKQPDVFVATGDLFDTSTPKEEERNLIVEAISKLIISLPYCVFIFDEGNHDWNSYKESMLRSLDLSYLPCGSRVNFVIHKEKLIKVKDSYFLCIPCQQKLTKKKIRKKVNKYIERVDGDFYVCLHECMKSRNDLGKEIGKESLPRIKGVTAWLLGDVHKHQFLLDNAWYCGSLMQTDFGERSGKGFVYIKDGEPEFIKLHNIKTLKTVVQGEKIPNPKRHFIRYIIKNSLSISSEKGIEKVTCFTKQLVTTKHIEIGMTSVTDGLPTILSLKYGYSKKMQNKAVKYVNAIVKGE